MVAVKTSSIGQYLDRISAACGIPDPAEACRVILNLVEEAKAEFPVVAKQTIMDLVILSTMAQRKKLIDKGLIDSVLADTLMDIIRNNVLEFWETLPVEIIIEALTSIGASPSILYDDHGRFAVLENGSHKTYFEEHGDFDAKWVGDPSDWKPTIRESVGEYINKLKKG